MKLSAAILLVGLIWPFPRRREATPAPQTTVETRDSASAAQDAIPDAACEHTHAGWYFMGPDQLIGFSGVSCPLAFQSWRATDLPQVAVLSL